MFLGAKLWIALAIVLVVGGLIGGLYYSVERYGELKIVAQSQSQAIQNYNQLVLQADTARTQLESEMQAARTKEADNLKVFTKHDFAKDLEAKPGLVAARIVNASNRMFDDLEAASRQTPESAAATGTGSTNTK